MDLYCLSIEGKLQVVRIVPTQHLTHSPEDDFGRAHVLSQ